MKYRIDRSWKQGSQKNQNKNQTLQLISQLFKNSSRPTHRSNQAQEGLRWTGSGHRRAGVPRVRGAVSAGNTPHFPHVFF